MTVALRRLKDRFRTRKHFSELKSIAEELARAQPEPREGQKRTGLQIQNLAGSVAKLSDNVGFGLEDIARVVLPGETIYVVNNGSMRVSNLHILS